MTDERMAEQVKAAGAALRATLTRLLRDDGVAPVSVVIVLAQLVGEIAVDDAATHHGVHDADAALGPVLRQVRRRADVPWLAAVIVTGGILGPLFLMLGLARTDAAASSLLNLEGLATMGIAWVVFR